MLATSSRPRNRATAPTALLGGQGYNAVRKRRSFYGVPYKDGVTPFQIWGSLVEKARYKLTTY